MTEQDKPLQPAAFSPHAPSATADPTSAQRPRWLLPALAALLVGAVVVFVILPQWVNDTASIKDAGLSTAESPSPPTSNAAIGSSAGDQAAGSERSPFAEAQLQKQRRAAQEALQTVLELQESLQGLAVDNWAADDYAAAIEQANAGDLAYRERRFPEAAAAYRRAGEQLLALEASLPQRIEATVAETRSAIERSDHAGAAAGLTLLELIALNDPRTANLSQRVAAMPLVSEALADADGAAQASDYGAAVAATERALTADGDHQRAAVLRARYQEALTEQRFRAAMTEGYLALEEEAFAAAEAAFKRAASLRPGAQEPQSAQAELASARTDAKLRDLRNRGEQQEAAETWQTAVETYQKALDIDSTLVFAREGLARSAPRAALSARIRGILDAPERLVDARALDAAEQTLTEARGIDNAGPQLTAMLAKLADTLDKARTPVSVTFTSDGVTDVTVLRVQRLGTLAQTALTLRPGNYTALGIRNGYRDVRIDFQVSPGTTPTVDVRCREAIGGA